MLVFLYMGGRHFSILENEVLKAAESNEIGYLSEYRQHLHLEKASFLLRPINVPSKNKWLRDTAFDL